MTSREASEYLWDVHNSIKKNVWQINYLYLSKVLFQFAAREEPYAVLFQNFFLERKFYKKRRQLDNDCCYLVIVMPDSCNTMVKLKVRQKSNAENHCELKSLTYY